MASPRQLLCSIFATYSNAPAQSQTQPKPASLQPSLPSSSLFKPATAPATPPNDADKVVRWFLRISQ